MYVANEHSENGPLKAKGENDMSYQTKNQSMGYILRAYLNAGTNTKELREVAYELNKIVPDVNDITNEDTSDYALHVLEDTKKEKAIKSAVYWVFDDYTVEEAGDMYDAFKVVLALRL